MKVYEGPKWQPYLILVKEAHKNCQKSQIPSKLWHLSKAWEKSKILFGYLSASITFSDKITQKCSNPLKKEPIKIKNWASLNKNIHEIWECYGLKTIQDYLWLSKFQCQGSSQPKCCWLSFRNDVTSCHQAHELGPDA